MFKNKFVNSIQTFKNEANVQFEPDSSPSVWEHYKKIYSRNEYLNNNYDFNDLFFYNCYKDFGLKRGIHAGYEWFNYLNKPLRTGSYYNRMFALEKGTNTKTFNNIKYIVASYRLGGDCDFNASRQEKANAVKQLTRCREMYHTLLNFSLMQALGNLQEFKGSNRFDRLDTFILDKYYRGISSVILQFSSPNNEPALVSFLNDFKDIYQYCATFYFITEKPFIDEIIKQGSMPITNVNELVGYMNLAEKYWAMKEFEFLKNEFLAVGDCFQNGGEIYSRNELITKIENDFGYSEKEIIELLNKCVDRGFIITTGDNAYTR